MAAFQIEKCIKNINIDLRMNSILVHCGAGVSRV